MNKQDPKFNFPKISDANWKFSMRSFCLVRVLAAIKVICSELQMDHIYRKLKFGLLSCNLQLVCVQYIKLVLPAGKFANSCITSPPWPPPLIWSFIFSAFHDSAIKDYRSNENYCDRKTCPVQFCGHLRYYLFWSKSNESSRCNCKLSTG